jgi:hypothetical protein
MNRRNLQMLLVTFALAGLAVPFFASRVTNEKDRPPRPRIDITELQPGSFIEVKLQTSRVFVLRNFDNQIHVYTVPFWSGAYWLPEFDWVHPAIACANFGPDNTNGILTKGGAFRCRLPRYGEFFSREHSWSFSGENLGYRTADMKIADYEIDENAVFLAHW